VTIVRSELIADASLPALRAFKRLGMAMAAMMAMIATTIISSIRVNPCFLFMGFLTSIPVYIFSSWIAFKGSSVYLPQQRVV